MSVSTVTDNGQTVDQEEMMLSLSKDTVTCRTDLLECCTDPSSSNLCTGMTDGSSTQLINDENTECTTLLPVNDENTEGSTLLPVNDENTEGSTLLPVNDENTEGSTLLPVNDDNTESSTLLPVNESMDTITSIKESKDKVSSIIGPDDAIMLRKCEDPDCSCGLIHCPYCEIRYFKPAAQSRVRDHLEMTHFAHAVQYDDLLIVKCFRTCKENYAPHYHCPLCHKYVMKRNTFARHLRSHIMKTGEDQNLMVMTDTKHPDRINILGRSVSVCSERCDEKRQPGKKHYHCPVCGLQREERSVFINHLWRCVDQDSMYTEVSQTGNPTDEQVTPLQPHMSIVRKLQDLPVERCGVDGCCDNGYHCQLCTTNKFKPASHQTLLKHLALHWRNSAQHNGLISLVCYLPCQIKSDDESGKQDIRYHYHCPVCGQTRRRRQAFKEHVEFCCYGNTATPGPLTSSYTLLEEREDASRPAGDSSTYGRSDQCEARTVSEDVTQPMCVEYTSNSDNIEHNTAVTSLPDRRDGFTDQESHSPQIQGSVPTPDNALVLDTADKDRQQLSDNVSDNICVPDVSTVICDEDKLNMPVLVGETTLTPESNTSETDACLAVVNEDEEDITQQTEHTDTQAASLETCPEEKIVHHQNIPESKSSRETDVEDLFSTSSATISGQVLQTLPSKKIIELLLTKVTMATHTQWVCSGKPDAESYTLTGRLEDLVVAKQRLATVINDIKDYEGDTEEYLNRLEVLSPAEDHNPQTFIPGSSGHPSKEMSLDNNTVDSNCDKVENVKKRGRGRPRKKVSQKRSETVKTETPITTDGGSKSDRDASRRQSKEVNTTISAETSSPRRTTRGIKMDFSLLHSGKRKSKTEDDGVGSVRKGVKLESVDGQNMSGHLRKTRKVLLQYTQNEDPQGRQYVSQESCVSGKASKVTQTAYLLHTGDNKVNNTETFPNKSSQRTSKVDESKLCSIETSRGMLTGTTDNVKRVASGKKSQELANTSRRERHNVATVPLILLQNDIVNVTVSSNDNSSKNIDTYHINTEHGQEGLVKSSDLKQSVIHDRLDSKKGNFVCNLCKKSFNSEPILKAHLTKFHSRRQPVAKVWKYSCPHCPYSCNSLEDIYAHKKLVHGEEIKCPLCSKVFVKGLYLQTHMNTVHPETAPVPCDLCGKEFTNSRYLQTHMRLHSAVRKFECRVCGKKFAFSYTLKLHMNTHKPVEEKTVRFMCSYCGKGCENRANLRDHINKHTGERPHACSECGKRFGFRTMLHKHKIFVHSTERPFKCNFCQKAFKLSRLLKNHLTTHTGQSDFICQTCLKPFSTKYILKLHQRKCKGKTWQQHQQQQTHTLQPAISQISGQPLTNTLIVLTDHTFTELDLQQITLGNPSVLTVPGKEQNIVDMVIKSELLEEHQENQDMLSDTSQAVAMETDNVGTGEATPSLQEQPRLECLPLMDAVMEPTEPVVTEDSGEVYVCSECDSTFSSFQAAEAHVLSVHMHTQGEITG